MSNVEMFKYYVSQLNLSKPQLEAITACVNACFEAGEEPQDDTGSELAVSEGFSPRTTKIGNQVWMAENLNIDDGGEGIFHHNGQTYYTWEAACRVAESIPGWHLPSKQEFETLVASCGGEKAGKAGKALKSTSGWELGGNGTDAFAFSALPVGYRSNIGYYDFEGYYAYFWSSTERNSGDGYYMYLFYGGDKAYLDNDYENSGVSVRLIKD